MKRYLIIAVVLMHIISCKNFSKKPEPEVLEDMVFIPAGEFIMGTNMNDDENKAELFGTPDPWFKAESPERKIYVDAFYIDKFEVTNKQYKEFIDATGYFLPPNWENHTFPQDTADHPVTFVSFFDAQQYALWAGKSIPTEAEWEKAARGTDGRFYPWGSSFDISKANLSISMNNPSKMAPAGLFRNGISPYGVYDMIGNAFEWTSSWYLPYEGNSFPDKDYGKKYRVIRGASYSYLGHFPDEIYNIVVEYMSMALIRQRALPTAIAPDAGFRCLKRI